MTQFWGKVTGNIGGSTKKISGDIFEKSLQVTGSVGEKVEIVSVRDYEKLQNKPRIESVELIGNRTLPEIGVNRVTNFDIEDILKS